jgi:hypothetical protein
MVLVESNERSATLRAPLKVRPPALVAVAFWLAAPLPLIVPDRSDTVHYAFSALLLAIGVVLTLSSVRRPASRLEFGPRVFRTDDHARPMAEAREVVLSGAPEEVADPTYRAELVFESGQRELLLEHSEPARVLRDLAALLPRLELPVRVGWGLPEGSRPWQSPSSPQSSARNVDGKDEAIVLEPPASARRPALALIIGAVVLGAIQAILIISAVKRASHVSPLSLGLALVSVVTVLAIGSIVWSRRIVVITGERVAVRVRVFGIDAGTLGEADAPLSDAWPVSPDGGPPRHVLVATAAGPLSVPCEGDAAAGLARTLKRRATSGTL